MREGLGVDSVRAGVSEGNEQTATEIIKREQKGELRSIDFLRVLDSQVLKPFLHMQHDLNLKKLSNYPFFNNELNTPDFLRVSKEELPKNVIFEVTGSKEVLGEEQTATEIIKREQKGELRSIDFLRVLDSQVLKPFLHMQHDLNLKKLSNYPFFNNELNTPDFLRVSKEELPKNVIFEVTGSKEVLGEEQRANKFVVAVQGAAQIPQVSQRTDWDEVATEVWRFTGLKDAERFVVKAETEVTPEQIQQVQQQLQQLQQALAEAQQKSVKDDIEKDSLNSDIQRLQREIAILEEKEQALSAIRAAEDQLDEERHRLELLREKMKNGNQAVR